MECGGGMIVSGLSWGCSGGRGGCHSGIEAVEYSEEQW